MIENKFIHYSTVAAFENDRQHGNIANTSIAFVEDPTGIRKIYTHGKEYVCTDYSQLIRDINDRIDAIIAGGGGGTVESDAQWDHAVDDINIYLGTSMPYTATPKVTHTLQTETVAYYSENTDVFRINENSGDIIWISDSAGALARVRATVTNAATGNPIKNLYYTVHLVQDTISMITWADGGVGKNALTTNEQTSFAKGTVTAKYASGKTEQLSSGVTYTATGGTFSQDYSTYTAPNSAGTYTIKAKVGNLTSQKSITVTVTAPIIPGYVGAGVDASSVMAVQGNRITNYGTGERQYQITALEDDYIYIILPKDTAYSSTKSGGQSAYIEKLQDITVGGVTYDVRRTLQVFAGTYTITIIYT